jgi:prepilin-type processing-associated H-X9-DG protein
VREAAARIQCQNNLKQMGLAVHNHHSTYKYMPTAGETDNYLNNRTLVGGAPATGAAQSWGWAYQILPFMEQDNLWKYVEPAATDPTKAAFQGDYFILNNIPPTYNCPSRRGKVSNQDPYPWNGVPVLDNPMDYAGNGGSFSWGYDRRATDGTTLNGPFQGVSHVYVNVGNLQVVTAQVRKGAPLSFNALTDGLSNTMLIGEKAVNSLTAQSGSDGTWGDDEGYVFGVAWDTLRYGQGGPGGNFTPFADAWGFPAHPVQDQPCPSNFSPSKPGANDTSPTFPGWPNYRWGSAHSSGFNVVLCDGSVRSISYNIDLAVLSYLCARNDGQVFNLDQ